MCPPAILQESRRYALPTCRPIGGNRTLFPLPYHQSRQRRRKLPWIAPNKFIRSNRDGLGTFGVVARSQAGYAKHRRFFGDAV